MEVQGSRGDMPPLHVHNRDKETFFVLDSELTLFVGREAMTLSKGDAAVAPREMAHSHRVESETATFLVINSPAGCERFRAAASEPAPRAELPPPGRQLEFAALARLAGEQGIEILGPPGALLA